MSRRRASIAAVAGVPGTNRASNAVALGWGLAEAVIFFIVPDVFLTRLALTDLRRALIACLWATAGALAGGAGLFLTARHGYGPALLHGYAWLPGISNDLLVRTAQAVHAHGAFAMFPGVVRGEPYKLFAVHSGIAGVPFGTFFAVSIIARVARFATTVMIARGISRLIPTARAKLRAQMHALFWIAFYTWYFAAMR